MKHAVQRWLGRKTKKWNLASANVSFFGVWFLTGILAFEIASGDQAVKLYSNTSILSTYLYAYGHYPLQTSVTGVAFSSFAPKYRLYPNY